MKKIEVTIGESSLGLVLVAGSAKGVCAVLLGDDANALRRDLRERFPGAAFFEADAAFGAIARRVTAFVDAPSRGIDVSLDLAGTEFQRKVWAALRDIPSGATVSYAELARRLGLPKSVRAVAGACAANALAVVVPCHRVVKSDGKLSGYRWGVERKRALLEKETVCSQPDSNRC